MVPKPPQKSILCILEDGASPKMAWKATTRRNWNDSAQKL